MSRDGYWDLKKSQDFIENKEKVLILFLKVSKRSQSLNPFEQSTRNWYWYHLRLKSLRLRLNILIETEIFWDSSVSHFSLTERKRRNRKEKRRNLTHSSLLRNSKLLEIGFETRLRLPQNLNKTETETFYIETRLWDWDFIETLIESLTPILSIET